MPLSFVWASLIIEVLFTCFSHLPPIVGVILAMIIFQEKHIKLNEDCKRYILVL